MKKPAIIIISLIAVAAAIFFFLRWRKKKAEQIPPVITPETLPQAPQPKTPASEWPWTIGLTSKNVPYVQQGLNWVFKTNLTVDGVFGEKTQAAIKKHLNKTTIGSPEDYANTLKFFTDRLIKK